MTRLGIVTGLAVEARLIEKAFARERHLMPALACAGADGARARAAAGRLLAQGAGALASFGLCGGLDPALRPGDLVLAEEVILRDGRTVTTDAARRGGLGRRLEEAGLRVAGGAVLGSDHAIAKADEKSALFTSLGARAVDMESRGVALAAEEAGIPFLVIRAVADPAERNLPRAALKATGPDGRVRLASVLATMYLRPWEGPAMVRLAYEVRMGLDTLERIAALRGALFGGH